MEFIKLNVNPKGWKTGDCVVRALTTATEMEWLEVYDGLCEIGRKKCRMPNDKITYEKFLKEQGFINCKMPRHADGSRYTVRELVDELGEGNILVMNVAHHVTVSVGDKLVDLWDCSSKSVGNYFKKASNRKITKVEVADRYKERVRLL